MKRERTSKSHSALVTGLLRLPIFYKILLANSAIVALGAVAGTLITVWHVLSFPHDFHYELIAYFAVAGFAISFGVDYLVLHLALRPLDRLQAGVDEVQSGRFDVRVDAGALSDERFDRLISTFNQMLDRLEQNAQQLHQLPGAILQAQEEERQRVARELHDEAAQALTSLLVRVRLLERSEAPEEARKHVQELRELTAEALEKVRLVALELRPTILDDLGLESALAWQVDELNMAGSTAAVLEVVGLQDRLPKNLELVLYRVAQEALSNVALHSKATHTRLTLRQEGERVTLEVVDDGRGFNAALARTVRPNGKGLGLLGMRERLALVGGELLVESQPGKGTRLIATAPVRAQPEQMLNGVHYAEDTRALG